MVTPVHSEMLQRWHLVGLHPTHDALIRRLASHECRMLEGESRNVSIEWSISERIGRWSDWASADEVDVIIVHATRLIEAVDAYVDHPQTFLSRTEHRRCLRLVWSGFDRDRKDLLWASSCLAHGVITNPAVLQSWIGSCVRNANAIPKPFHPFLRKIQPSAI